MLQLDERIQHRLQIERRAADDLEHVRGGCLLLQERLGEIMGARLHLVEQAHIADRDHRLIGEGLQQRDLLFAEGMHLDAAHDDRADTLALARQRHREDGAVAHAPRELPAVGEFLAFLRQVMDMDRPLVDEGAPDHPLAVDRPFFEAVKRNRGHDAR